MSLQPTDPIRPPYKPVNTDAGPVVDEARVASTVRLVAVVIVTVAGLFGLDLTGLEDLAERVALGVVAAILLVGALVDFLLSRYRAWRTREYVTPIDRPKDDFGRPLVPADD